MGEKEEKNRLSKVMARAGVASRRKAEEMIFSGKVSVNGEIVLQPQTMVGESDEICIDGKPLPKVEKKVYYLLNKPRGFVCSNLSKWGDALVVDLFKEVPYRLFTVGRLDKETTGLLIVTNDGHFAQRLIHPSANIEKEYLVTADRIPAAAEIEKLKRGCSVEGVFIVPKRVERLTGKRLSIVVMEGKKREVRLLMESAGLATVALCRVRIGGLNLRDLKEGEWREIEGRECEKLVMK